MDRLICLTLVGVFIFCQVIGIMCLGTNVSFAGEYSIETEEMSPCPMDTAMCPTSLFSTPERHVKEKATAITGFDGSTVEFSEPLVEEILAYGPRSRVSSLVPSPTRSVPVLRI